MSVCWLFHKFGKWKPYADAGWAVGGLSNYAVRIWRAVLHHLAQEGVELHAGCENDPPEECSLFETIADAIKE